MSRRATAGETTRAVRLVAMAASVCLQYPDPWVLERLPVVRAAAGGRHAGLDTFLAWADATSPAAAARHYVEVFDQSRRHCLELSYWTDGDTRRRGAVLAGLKDRYRAAGFEPQGTELPDFLPVVLEYVAAEPADGLALLLAYRPGLELLRLALAEAGTPYAGPVAAATSLLPGPSPADRAAAHALAAAGPPVEQVGLAGYGGSPGPVPVTIGAAGGGTSWR